MFRRNYTLVLLDKLVNTSGLNQSQRQRVAVLHHPSASSSGVAVPLAVQQVYVNAEGKGLARGGPVQA